MKDRIIGDFLEFCIAVPILERKKFVFEIRSKNLKSQPGEISFPGGSMEKNETPQMCALRELKEEIGPSVSKYIGKFGILITPYNYKLHVFLFEVENEFNLNKDEVEEIFIAPIEFFKTPNRISQVRVHLKPEEDFPYEWIPKGKNYDWKEGKYKVYFYLYENKIIWGITARIAYEIANSNLF